MNQQPGKRAWIIIAVMLLVCGLMVLPKYLARKPPATAPDQSQPVQSSQPIAARRTSTPSVLLGPKFVLRVINANSSTPVAGLNIAASGRRENASVPIGSFITDGNGEARISMPQDPLGDLTLKTEGDGYPPYTLSWSARRQEVIPESYEFRIHPASRMGGFVRNGKGEPIAGATVHPFWRRTLGSELAHEQFNNQLHSETTDSDGHWICTHFPEESMELLNIRVQHPDYPNTEFATELAIRNASGSIPSPIATRLQVADLKAGVAVMTLGQWFDVTGKVVNQEGKPITGARIFPGESMVVQGGRSGATIIPTSRNLKIQETNTDENGEFRLSFGNVGSDRITAQADRYAPQTLPVTVARETAPLLFTLSSGNLIRGKVVDAAGNSLAGAKILVSGWREPTARRTASGTFYSSSSEQRTLRVSLVTDDNGQFEWESAPEGTITFSVTKEGFDPSSIPVTVPTDREQTITLTTVRFVTVKVVDADTKMPLHNYTVTLVRSSSGSGGSSPTRVSNSDDGTHRIALSPPGETYTVLAEAEGYIRMGSEPIVGSEPPPNEAGPRLLSGLPAPQRPSANDPAADVTRLIELKRGDPIEGFVFDSSGNPVAGAQVSSHSKTAGMGISNGRLSATPSTQVLELNSTKSTDSAGHFRLEMRPNQATVVAAHDLGFTEVSLSEFSVSKILTLQPWAKIQGTIHSQGASLPNVRLSWRPADNAIYVGPSPLTALPPGLSVWFNATADADGKFTFNKIPPGTFKFSTAYSQLPPGVISAMRSQTENPFSFRSGETLTVDLGD